MPAHNAAPNRAATPSPPGRSAAGAGQRSRGREQLAQPVDLHVATREHHGDPLAVADRNATGQDRGQRRRTGRLEDLLESLDGKAHPGQDRRVVEQDDVVEVAPGHRERPDARRMERRGRRPRCPAGSGRSRSAFDRQAQRVRALRLDAVDADARATLLQCRGDAGDQPTAAHATTATSSSGMSSRSSRPIDP